MSNINKNNIEEKETLKKLSLTNDFVFKRIFAKKGNEGFLKDFLSSLLKLDIKEIEVAQDIMLAKKIKEDKYGVLDIKATLNNNIEVDIEMQVRDNGNIIERTTYYSSKTISGQLRSKEDYTLMRPVIVIAILGYELFDSKKYITKGVVKDEEESDKIINHLLKFYYIELPKFRNQKVDLDDKVNQWLTLIDSTDEKGLIEAMDKNEELKKANEELELLSADEEARELAEFRESSIREMASARRYGEERGKTIGIAEGIAQEKLNIAKSMLKKGIDIQTISEITELSSEEIEKLK